MRAPNTVLDPMTQMSYLNRADMNVILNKLTVPGRTCAELDRDQTQGMASRVLKDTLPKRYDYRYVDVYRNLHTGGYSVRDVKSRRVIAHVRSIVLMFATFVCRQAGRALVRMTGRKNVHAFVRGLAVIDPGLIASNIVEASKAGRPDWPLVTYNPYDEVPGFHLTRLGHRPPWPQVRVSQVVKSAGVVVLAPNGAACSSPVGSRTLN